MSRKAAIDPSATVWCLHCERIYEKGERRLVNRMERCPYPHCEGLIAVDQWHWSQIRRVNPGYPAIPERNVVYPLYGPIDGGPPRGHS